MPSKRAQKKPASTSGPEKRNLRVSEGEIEKLRSQLHEAEAILDAIRSGQVEALVVNSPAGDQVYTLKGADHAYRVFIEAMSEGAVTVGENGVILYSNKRFAEMLRVPLEEVIGSFFQQHLPKEQHGPFEELLLKARREVSKRDFTLRNRNAAAVPVQVSVAPLEGEGARSWCLVVTDMTQQKQVEERLLTLSHRLLDVQETERRHLARELHDEVGQILTGLKITLETNSFLAKEGQGQDAFQRARDQVQDLMQRVQDISLDLRPAMLDDLGLLPALLWHFERYREQTSVQVNFRHAGLKDQRFSPELETAAYRIVQEALTNVARHAQAKAVDVYVHCGVKALTIQIEDEGRGFEVARALSSRSSSGLTGMQERAALLAGELLLQSAPGRGTQVRAKLPFFGVASDR